MSELVSIATFAAFADAAALAKELAINHQRETGVQRAGNEWAVVIAAELLAELRAAVAGDPGESEWDFDDHSELIDGDYADAMRDIHCELLEAQEDWERSDEEGWFYAD